MSTQQNSEKSFAERHQVLWNKFNFIKNKTWREYIIDAIVSIEQLGIQKEIIDYTPDKRILKIPDKIYKILDVMETGKFHSGGSLFGIIGDVHEYYTKGYNQYKDDFGKPKEMVFPNRISFKNTENTTIIKKQK